MDWWLNTIGNSLQIVGSIAFFGAAIQWGRSIMKDHEISTILIATILGLSVLVSTASLSERLGMLPIRKQEQVFNKHFNNEPVVLDDHEFYNCVFENVTIKYAGGSYRIENPKFVQPIKLQTTSLVAFRTVALLRDLGALNPAIINQ
jgi:hypothetical protein